MNWQLKRTLGALAVTLCAYPAFASDNPKERSLGGYPLCEASAAIILNCPEDKEKDKDKDKKRDKNGERLCLLVGDNEVRDRLFLFDISETNEEVLLEDRRELHLNSLSKKDNFQISDIEALVDLEARDILIYGSHSRNKACKDRENRRRFAHGKLKKTKIGKGLNKPGKSDEHTCRLLFGENRTDDMQKVCAEIERREALADAARGKTSEDDRISACNSDPAFNLEGAVAVPDAQGNTRVWIGLRAPLVGGKAVLLRQVENLKKFRFDGVAFVKLKGRGDFPNYGIRELTLSGDKIWGIGGPPPDPPENGKKPDHTLWSIKAADLEDGADLKAKKEPDDQPANKGQDDLPPSSEGLAILDGKALVLIDGDDAGDSNPMVCRKPSTYIVHNIGN